MNSSHRRDPGHGSPKPAALLFPVLLLIGCASGNSGHAPGVAGGQTQDPGTINFPLAYVKRPVQVKDIDVRDLITSTAGADLYVRDQASAGGVEVNITKSITKGAGFVRDLDVSPDGKKLVFSLRLPLIPNAKEIDQPRWQIWEYDAVARTTRQITTDAKGHDISPHYLPDGRIVFASTRQAKTQGILLDENRPQYPAQTDDRTQSIFLLHVMDADGSKIHQISFNTNHDFAPSVLSNGQIVFSRWEHTNGADQISLYRTNPDGTGLELYYGANSHATGVNSAGTNSNVVQFLGARQRTDGKLIAIARPFLGTQLGGDILTIDAEQFVEIDQTTLASAGTAGPAQKSTTTLGVTTDMNKPSPGGRFASAYPLYDGTNRLLVSWSPCLVLDATVTPAATRVCNSGNTSGATVQLAPPQYTIWLYSLDTNTLSPLLSAEPGKMIVDPLVLQARTPAPAFIPDSKPSVDPGKTLAEKSLGLLVIRSVYDFDGVDNAKPNIAGLADPKQTTADQRPARFIRIEKAVEIPDDKVRKFSDSAFGPAGMGMREILAYAPVEPDGSIKIEVPANVPFTIDVLDKNARRVGNRHTSWLQLMPGETRTCNGCHIANKAGSVTPSHGRTGLTASVNQGAPATGFFPNTIKALIADSGDIMAETLARNSCQTAANCSEIPSVDVIYADLWTDPVAAARARDASFSYLYSALQTTPPVKTTVPVDAHCTPWGGQCRITIHYLAHIQPLWALPRQTFAADGVTVLTDHTCVLCHSPVDAANASQLPAGQLDLTDAVSVQDPSVVTSYRQLLFSHNEQALNMGMLQDVLVPGPIDPTTGLPTMVPVSLGGPMTAGSALASAPFLSVFDGPGDTVNHKGYLSTAELRLIAEWLDIGAQYYNDPFVAPAQ
jgi:hypothetical protein